MYHTVAIKVGDKLKLLLLLVFPKSKTMKVVKRMKKSLIGMITVFVIAAITVCSAFCVSAADTDTVTFDFEAGSGDFIPPGDLNANGRVDAEDLVLLKKVLLSTTKAGYSEVYAEIGIDAKFSDANGDGNVNILDLVRAKKSAAKTFIGTDVGINGTAGMNIYGNVAYSGELTQMLKADKYYRISFDYKADSALKLTVNGISNQVYAFESKASDDWQTETYLIATAEEFGTVSDIVLQICGSGVVDNIKITPCIIDNDLADPW